MATRRFLSVRPEREKEREGERERERVGEREGGKEGKKEGRDASVHISGEEVDAYSYFQKFHHCSSVAFLRQYRCYFRYCYYYFYYYCFRY